VCVCVCVRACVRSCEWDGEADGEEKGRERKGMELTVNSTVRVHMQMIFAVCTEVGRLMYTFSLTRMRMTTRYHC